MATMTAYLAALRARDLHEHLIRFDDIDRVVGQPAEYFYRAALTSFDELSATMDELKLEHAEAAKLEAA